MNDQQPPAAAPPPTTTTPRQSRRGRRRTDPKNEEKQPDEKSLLASSPKSNSTSSRKWTRSLSPRRLAGRGNDIDGGDDVKPDASFMAQMNSSFGSGLMAFTKRLTGRAGVRSQSPMPRKDLMGPLESPTVARISQPENNKDRRKSPKRSRSNPRPARSKSKREEPSAAPTSSLTRSKSDSVPRSRLRRHRSTSPRKASSDDFLEKRKMDATDHDSRSGRNAPLRPPSGLNLRQIMDQQDQMHESYNAKNENFMLLESDDSEITASNLNLSPTDTIKMAAAAVKAEHKDKQKREGKQVSRQPSSQSSSRSSSRSQQRRQRSARHLKSMNDMDDVIDKRKKEMERPSPSSSRSLDMTKPSSDPGKGGRSGTPSRRPPSFRKTRSGDKKSSSSSSSGNKPPSVRTLTGTSSHEKPSSDPGRYGGGAKSTKPPRSSSNVSSNSASSSNHGPTPARTADKKIIERPNLGKESLQHVADVKDSIRRMRTQQYTHRNKVRIATGKETPGTSKSKSAPPSMPANAAAIASNLHDSQSTLSRQGGSGSSLTYTADSQNSSTSFVRLQPGISVSDLEVGFLKSPAIARQGLSSNSNVVSQNQPFSSAADPPSDDAGQKRQEKAESLMKSIKKTKKLIKRTCRDVWAERDEVVHLQRTNWSIRKALLQTDVPKDSVTSLNLKIETALRQEREVSDDLDELYDEKQKVDLECSMLAKSIEEFKDLLDALNTQVVPLFPPDVEPSDEYDYEQEGTTATAAVVDLMDDDDFDDSIDSTNEL